MSKVAVLQAPEAYLEGKLRTLDRDEHHEIRNTHKSYSGRLTQKSRTTIRIAIIV